MKRRRIKNPSLRQLCCHPEETELCSAVIERVATPAHHVDHIIRLVRLQKDTNHLIERDNCMVPPRNSCKETHQKVLANEGISNRRVDFFFKSEYIVVHISRPSKDSGSMDYKSTKWVPVDTKVKMHISQIK